jgi:hypothetical protein
MTTASESLTLQKNTESSISSLESSSSSVTSTIDDFSTSAKSGKDVFSSLDLSFLSGGGNIMTQLVNKASSYLSDGFSDLNSSSSSLSDNIKIATDTDVSSIIATVRVIKDSTSSLMNLIPLVGIFNTGFSKVLDLQKGINILSSFGTYLNAISGVSGTLGTANSLLAQANSNSWISSSTKSSLNSRFTSVLGIMFINNNGVPNISGLANNALNGVATLSQITSFANKLSSIYNTIGDSMKDIKNYNILCGDCRKDNSSSFIWW